MFKIKKLLTCMLIGICVLSGVTALSVIHEAKVVHAEAVIETDTFTYDGTNASAYKGESVFILTEGAYSKITKDTHYFEIGWDLGEIRNKLGSVKTVIIDDSTTKVYYCMLGYFNNATTLHIGKKVNAIDMYDGGIGNMMALSTIEVDKENTNFKLVNNVLYNSDMTTLVLYPPKKKDASYSIPDTVKNFSAGYLIMNYYLRKLDFGKSFGPIKAPYEYNDFDSLWLPELQEITVDQDNESLSAVDGVLYDKEQTKTIAWPAKLIVENVVFPSTLKSTSFYMISNKNNVKTITLSKAMESIWVFDFTSRLSGFANLEKISVPSDNQFFTVWKGGLYNKTKTIFYGFPRNSPLTTLELSKGIVTPEIWNNVYPNIEKVILPSTFTGFYTHEGGGFREFYMMFPKLKSVQISSDCKTYKSVGGVVFGKKGTKLILYPVQKEGYTYVMPDSVEIIRDGAFSGCTKLHTLTIGKNLLADQQWWNVMQHSNIISFKTVKNGKNYKASDGILYSKDMTVLKAYPPNKQAATYKVPNSVYDISKLCYARELKTLVLGKKVRITYGMYDLKKLTVITVSESNPYYTSKDGILFNKKITMLEFYPTGRNATTYKMPDSVTNITKLNYVSELENLVLGKNVQYISDFYAMPKLDSISVSEENPYYMSKDGVLYNKDMTKIEAYPEYKKATTYIVPDSVTDITKMFKARGIETLVLGKNVKDLCEFMYMTLLNKITVSKDNPYYMSKDGVLYDKTGIELIYDPINGYKSLY